MLTCQCLSPRCIVLAPVARHRGLDNGVALARGAFEAAAIENLDPPPTIVDETLCLHRMQRNRHGFTAGA